MRTASELDDRRVALAYRPWPSRGARTGLHRVACVVAALGLSSLHGAMAANLDTSSASGPRPVVIDGDTVQTGDGLVNLAGLDAPELGQRCRLADRWIDCGQQAAFALNRVLGLSLAPLRCAPAATMPDTAAQEEAQEKANTQPRTATCALDGRTDLAVALLSQGLALTLPDAPPRYHEAEESARVGRLGLWRTDFVRPADWRKGRRLPEDPVVDLAPCPIIALTDPEGRRVFLVPLDPDHAAIPPDTVEARYCSDDAAIADGWTRRPLSTPNQP